MVNTNVIQQYLNNVILLLYILYDHHVTCDTLGANDVNQKVIETIAVH